MRRGFASGLRIGYHVAVKYYGPELLERGPCPYLPDRDWRSLSLDVVDVSPEEFDFLLEAGFRRSGTEFYVPRCTGCQECLPLRVPVASFRPSRTQRRVARANLDVAVLEESCGCTDEKLALYRRFLEVRFGRERLPGPREFDDFLGFHFGNGLELDYRLEGRLVGFGILDVTPRAASSVYFVFDPDLAGRRLGVFSVLEEIEWVRRTGREYLYLGLWVAGCRSMRYKDEYRPHELLEPGRGWAPGRPAPAR